MDMTSTRTVPAPVAVVWAALNDPATLKGCIPGCDALEPDGENAFRIAIATRVGPVAAKFTGRMLLSDVDPLHGYTLSFEGQGGAAGFAKGEARVSLAPAENDKVTMLSYAVKAQVGGKIAQIGSRLIDGAAQKLADEFFASFSNAVAAANESVVPSVLASPAVRAGERRWLRYAAVAIVVITFVIAYVITRAAG